jgi:hypothetical protein
LSSHVFLPGFQFFLIYSSLPLFPYFAVGPFCISKLIKISADLKNIGQLGTPEAYLPFCWGCLLILDELVIFMSFSQHGTS